MPELTIGRVGFDFDLDNPNQIRTRVDGRRARVDISGELRSTSLANTKALKSELEGHAEKQDAVAVTMNDDAFVDGFYIVTDANVDAEDYALNSSGLFDFRITLERIGTAQATEFTSLIDGLLIANDYGLEEGEIKYTWSPPVGAEAVTNAGTPTGHERTTSDGAIEVYVGVDVDLDPSWSVDPGNYYKGAAKITLGGYTRTGLDAPEDLTSWNIGNGIVEVFADGSNDGIINLQHAVDQTKYGFKIMFESTTAIPAWNYPSIVANTPEECRLRLTRDANEDPPTDSLHQLDIVVRRGCPYAICVYSWTGSATTFSVDRESTDAATGVTPTGATGNMAVEDSANDADGNRWFLGGFTHDSVDTTNGGLNWTTNTNKFAFVLGIEIGGSNAHARDDTGDVMLQAAGQLGETVRPSRR